MNGALAGGAPSNGSGDSGGRTPEQGGGPGGERGNAERANGERGGDRGAISDEMRKRFESMTPEEREKMREQFRNRGGRGGGTNGEGEKSAESKSGG
jgi:hypothetical protein